MLKNKIVSFTCYDAGPAEIISNYIKAKKIENYNLTLGNVSKTIFLRNKVKIKKNINLSECLKKSDIFIMGTSWKYKKELKLISKIKKINKKSIVILDDFVNLKKRFWFNNKYIFPNQIWIPNNIPKEKIDLNFFNECKIKFINNYYLLNIKKKIKKIKKNSNYNKNFLFFSQPIREISSKFTLKKIKHDEYDYCEKFLTKLNKVFIKKKIKKISISLHPTEKKNKFNNLFKKFKNLPIKISKNNLINDINQHYYIFGVNTNAMKIALLNENVVVSMLNKKKIIDFFLTKKVLSFKEYN